MRGGRSREAGCPGTQERGHRFTGENSRAKCCRESRERGIEMNPLTQPEGALETLSSASGGRVGQREGRRDNSS